MRNIATLAATALVLAGFACSSGKDDTVIDTGVDIPVSDIQRDDTTTTDPVVDPTVDNRPDPTGDPDSISPDLPPDGVTTMYGTLNANFTTNFIFDYDQLSNSAYVQAHISGAMQTAAFTGTYSTGKTVPGSTATTTVAYAAHIPAEGTAPAAVMVYQDSCVDPQCNTGADPQVRLLFANDTITTGALPVDLTVATSPMLLLMNFPGSTGCVLAIGHGGSISVTTATNTSAADGGSLAFTGAALPIYHPTGTPLGDISGELTGYGLTICPKE